MGSHRVFSHDVTAAMLGDKENYKYQLVWVCLVLHCLLERIDISNYAGAGCWANSRSGASGWHSGSRYRCV